VLYGPSRSSRTSCELQCVRWPRGGRRADWFAPSSRSAQRDAKNTKEQRLMDTESASAEGSVSRARDQGLGQRRVDGEAAVASIGAAVQLRHQAQRRRR
jgi:hypothetical protein